MLTRNDGQIELVMMTIEDLMPQEHFLRDLDKYVDFSFIYNKVEHLYSETGRPSVDPVMLFKMILIGFLYGIESEIKTRKRKFDDSEIFREIFNEIIRRCVETGLVSAENLVVDSTHIKANVAKNKREIITVDIEPSEYMKKLDEIEF